MGSTEAILGGKNDHFNSDEGAEGGRSVVTGGIEKMLRLMLMEVIGTVGLWRHNHAFLLLAHMLVKKYCHHMILRWCPTNLGLLYTMVPEDWHGNVSRWFY